MKSNLKILMLYAQLGGGHESLAYGLAERLIKEFPKAEIEFASPLSSSLNTTYQLTTRLSPAVFNLYSKFYELALPQKIINKMITRPYRKALKEVIRKTKPGLIVSTFYLFENSNIKHDGPKIPLALYVADPFTPHPIWLTTKADIYMTFDDKMASVFSKRHPAEKISSIGIPTRLAFQKKYNRQETLKNLGLKQERFTILFGGSGMGMDHLEKIAKPIGDLNLPFQAIFLCGRSKHLFQNLCRTFKNKSSFKTLGYLAPEEMAKVMQACDLFVGKAGPNVLFEAVHCQLPMLLTPPILAQEKANRDYVLKNNLGFVSKSNHETLKILKEIINNPGSLKEKKKNLAQIKRDLVQKEKIGLDNFFQWIKSQKGLKELKSN